MWTLRKEGRQAADRGSDAGESQYVFEDDLPPSYNVAPPTYQPRMLGPLPNERPARDIPIRRLCAENAVCLFVLLGQHILERHCEERMAKTVGWCVSQKSV